MESRSSSAELDGLSYFFCSVSSKNLRFFFMPKANRHPNQSHNLIHLIKICSLLFVIRDSLSSVQTILGSCLLKLSDSDL